MRSPYLIVNKFLNKSDEVCLNLNLNRKATFGKGTNTQRRDILYRIMDKHQRWAKEYK